MIEIGTKLYLDEAAAYLLNALEKSTDKQFTIAEFLGAYWAVAAEYAESKHQKEFPKSDGKARIYDVRWKRKNGTSGGLLDGNADRVVYKIRELIMEGLAEATITEWHGKETSNPDAKAPAKD